jgi:hypothetical protein
VQRANVITMKQTEGSGVPSTGRRSFVRWAGGAGLLAAAGQARALMAGAAPDSPAARVDPNSPSSHWCGVVCVVVNGSPFSGVVVANQYVLTAAHVAGGASPGTIQVIVNATAAPVTLAVAATSIYPGTVFPYDDLALLQLADPLPREAFVYPIVDAAVPGGTALTLVGYGGSGSGSNGAVTVGANPNVKRTGRNTLDVLTDRLDSSGRTSAFFVYDFDSPSGTGPLGGASLGNAFETTVASGDSGSPVFVDTGDGPMLFGISSFSLALTAGIAATAFGGGGGGMVLSHPPFVAWLKQQTGNAVMLQSMLPSADAPLPAWALASLGAGLAWRLWRGRGERAGDD